MARLENVSLSARGKRGDAVITARGQIVWEAGEFSLNGANLLIHFWGRDKGLRESDDNRHAIELRFTRASTSVSEWEGSRLELTANDDGHQFVWSVPNDKLDIGAVLEAGKRRFNEDVPGSDEIYATLVVRDSDTGANLSEEVRTNMVTGRF